MVSVDRVSLQASAYQLSQEDIDGIVTFAGDCSRILGTALRGISLEGETSAPVMSVAFVDERQRPGVLYSYEWRLGDVDDPDDLNTLAVLLVDHLGNNIVEDLTPGLPIWDPYDDGIVHVQVKSERYRAWPQEWRTLARPWRDEDRHLRRADR